MLHVPHVCRAAGVSWPGRLLRVGFLFVVMIVLATYTANLAAILNRPTYIIEGPKTFDDLKQATVCVNTKDVYLDSYVKSQVGKPIEGGVDAFGFMGEMGFSDTSSEDGGNDEEGENGEAGENGEKGEDGENVEVLGGDSGEVLGGDGNVGLGAEAAAQVRELNAVERMKWCHTALENGEVDAWFDLQHSLHSYMLNDCDTTSILAMSSSLSFIPTRFGIVFRLENSTLANHVTSAMQHIQSMPAFAETEAAFFKTGELCPPLESTG